MLCISIYFPNKLWHYLFGRFDQKGTTMLMGNQNATVQRIMPVATHGQKNFRVLLEIDSMPGIPQQAQFAAEAFDENIMPGDSVSVNFVAGVAVDIHKK